MAPIFRADCYSFYFYTGQNYMKKGERDPKKKKIKRTRKKKDLHFLCVYEFNVFLY